MGYWKSKGKWKGMDKNMRYSVMGIWNSTSDKFIEMIPLVYHNGNWYGASAKVYDENQWKQIGGAKTLMVPFITSDGNYFYTSDGKMFLVRQHE